MKNTRKKNQFSNQNGFSFLEIIIVIGIIGGLLAFILPQIQNNQARAKVGQSKLAMGNIIQNLTMYQNDCTKFPTSLEGLVKSDGCANWNGPYLKSVPPDGFGTKFIYESDGSTFTVRSLGGDRKEGGDGYNRDITQEDL
jgi:general secretion pathway protein G